MVVPNKVTEVVVERGDRQTLRTLAANQGAQFSSTGMAKLIDRASDDCVLQEVIVERSDLSNEAVDSLLAMVGEELAARLHDKSIDSAAVARHVAAWVKGREHNVAMTDDYIARIRQGRLNINDILENLARRGRMLDAVTVLAAFIDLDRDYVLHQLAQGPERSVLLLLRSIDIKWAAVEHFLELRRSKRGDWEFDDFAASAPRREALRKDYMAMDIAAAQRVLRFMKVRRTAARQPALAS